MANVAKHTWAAIPCLHYYTWPVLLKKVEKVVALPMPLLLMGSIRFQNVNIISNPVPSSIVQQPFPPKTNQLLMPMKTKGHDFSSNVFLNLISGHMLIDYTGREMDRTMDVLKWLQNNILPIMLICGLLNLVLTILCCSHWRIHTGGTFYHS